MKTVKQFHERLLNARSFSEKYPEYQPNDTKIHVLFLSPCMNETGFYRMILPALELNRTNTHSAIVGHIHKWDFNKQFDDYDTPVDLRLVEWADYVVLPVMFSKAAYIITTMREINDDIEFVMDMDCNYHDLPGYHPDFKKLGSVEKNILVKNLSKIDILTAPNMSILNYYNNLVQQNEDNFSLYFENYPNLLSYFMFEEVPQIYQNTTNKIRMGLILDPSQVDDVKTIEEPLTSLLRKHEEKIELVIFGWTYKIAEQNGLFKELKNVVYEKAALFTQHHYRLNELRLDIGLIPIVDNIYNASGKALNRFLDFSAFAIPVVAPDQLPFKKIIKDGENGFLTASGDEWTGKAERLINEASLRKELGKAAFKTAWERFSYNQKTNQRLTNIFI